MTNSFHATGNKKFIKALKNELKIQKEKIILDPSFSKTEKQQKIKTLESDFIAKQKEANLSNF